MSIKQVIRDVLPYGMVQAIREKRPAPQAEPAPISYMKIDSRQPEIYNKNGEKMHSFYMQDDMSPDYPCSFVYGAMPKYIHWDRYNYCLDTQFYSHHCILDLKPYQPKKRFAYFIESETIATDSYHLFDKHEVLSSQFTAIFTHSQQHLEKYPNAKFCVGGGVWYGNSIYAGGTLDPLAFENKQKNISIVSSHKAFCPLHNYRIQLAKSLKSQGKADAMGTFDGGEKIKIAQSLIDYRYSIVIENNITPYYFTEKIMNCFASMTVPIYIGATAIDKFFNMDGIIYIKESQLEDVEKIISMCSEQDYIQRLPAIIDNYNRVQKYLTIEDWLFNTYGELLY